MISPHVMAEAYGRNVQIIQLQTTGLSQADSLVQLPFRSNCMNWIVGHLVTNRISVLKLLEIEPLPFDVGLVARYNRESAPITGEEAGVLPLDQLGALLEQSQACLARRLDSLAPEALDRQIAFFGNRSMSVGEWLLFFFFHDSYHTGQAEILRQAAGKDDKII